MSRYRVILLKAWTKDMLVQRIAEALEPYDREEILSIQPRVDFQISWPWRRNWAVIVVDSDGPLGEYREEASQSQV